MRVPTLSKILGSSVLNVLYLSEALILNSASALHHPRAMHINIEACQIPISSLALLLTL